MCVLCIALDAKGKRDYMEEPRPGKQPYPNEYYSHWPVFVTDRLYLLVVLSLFLAKETFITCSYNYHSKQPGYTVSLINFQGRGLRGGKVGEEKEVPCHGRINLWLQNHFATS